MRFRIERRVVQLEVYEVDAENSEHARRAFVEEGAGRRVETRHAESGEIVRISRVSPTTDEVAALILRGISGAGDGEWSGCTVDGNPSDLHVFSDYGDHYRVSVVVEA